MLEIKGIIAIPFIVTEVVMMNYVMCGFVIALSSSVVGDAKAPAKKKLEKVQEGALALIRTTSQREVADRVLATIYHPEGTVLVCQSDLRPGLGGQAPTLRDAIIKELIILDGKTLAKAKMLQMGTTEDEVEKALSRAQEQLSMSREELVAFFKEQGLTLEEAKKELERGLIVENVIGTRVQTKAQISNKAIEQYHKDHPIITYTLQQAFVPLGASSKALTRALIEREIASKEIEQSVKWIDLGAIPEKDFAQDKAFIKDLPSGSVVITDETDEGFTLLKLVARNEIALEARKNEIANKLGQERMMQTQKAYFEGLLKDANIRYTDLVKA